MFVDIHSHILPGIDDGAADFDASIEMLEMCAAEGEGSFMLATPHYICGSLKNSTDIVEGKLKELYDTLVKKGLNVNIRSGNEIFLSTEVPELLADKEICTLAGSSYVLVELPMMMVPDYTDEVLYRLKLKGYNPIIAHPERNQEIMRDPNILYGFISKGMYSQVNASSLKGVYGRHVRDAALTLIQHNLVHFVASDAHSCRGRSPKLQKAFDIVRAGFGNDMAEKLFCRNGLAVLENRGLEAAEPVEIKRGLIKSIHNTITKLRAIGV